MFKATVLLCAGIYAAMLLGGVDRGQVRFGLMPQTQPPRPVIAAVAADPAPQPVAEAFAPSQPVMVTPAVAVVSAQAELPDAVAESAVPVQYVTTNAKLREGPGTDFAVLGRLPAGEAVQVVEVLPDGWTRVRIEGDGGEGFVATRLLSE